MSEVQSAVTRVEQASDQATKSILQLKSEMETLLQEANKTMKDLRDKKHGDKK
jgi:hypothetical protein